MADTLPPLTPRSAAKRQAEQSPRRRRQPSFESPRRAVQEVAAGGPTLPPPPKSFAAMYTRRTDWAEVTGLCVRCKRTHAPCVKPPVPLCGRCVVDGCCCCRRRCVRCVFLSVVHRRGDDAGSTSSLSPRYSQTFSPRSSASSIGYSQSGLAAEELWEKELAERHNALVSRQQNHERKVRQRAAGSIVNRAFD